MRKIILTCLGLMLMSYTWAEPLNIAYGVSLVDLNADGTKDLIVRTRWENGNAHGFDSYTIAIAAKDMQGKEVFYQVRRDATEEKTLRTQEGADCVTADDRTMQVGLQFGLNAQGWLNVWEYARAVTPATPPYAVTKTRYALRQYPNPEAGQGMFALVPMGTVTLPKRACDVREVMP